MENECKRFPRKVLKECGKGAEEVNYNGSQWNGNVRFIERKGKRISSKYSCSKIPRGCIKKEK